MNGRLTPSRPAPLSWNSRDVALLHLCIALLASSLLHATLVLLPFLGKSNMTAHSDMRQELAQRQPIQATLRPLTVNTSSTFSLPPPIQSSTAAPSELEIALKLTGEMSVPISPPPLERSLGADLLPIPAPDYYPPEQLTKRPQPTKAAALDTPNTDPVVASGEITLKLWIDDFGEVANAEIEKTSMPEIFSTQAITAFKHLRFIPGERNGQRVRSVIRIEIKYEDGRVPPR